jgi:mono/diheme cytochrome c family protein
MVMRGTRRGYGGWPLWAGLGVGVLGLAAWPHPATGQDAPVAKIAPEAAAFFESKVRPVLLDNCVSCHGKDVQLSGLRMDSREALLKGGASGPAIVPGDPEKSLLIQVIRHTGKIKMPQGGKLKDEQIVALAEWIKIGAPWPASTLTPSPNAVKGGANTHWSFRPVKKPVTPKIKTAKWAINPIDTFILAKLESQGLQPNAMADKRTQLRRVTFDLTGLPPTYAEMQAFLADKSPDAYTKAVDRLLDSPRYGERWARLWLDVARYADTKGYVFVDDRNYYNAYTYRDWVIRSLNEDLPYDRFIMEQLAEDRMPEVQNGDDKRPLSAMGFHTI